VLTTPVHAVQIEFEDPAGLVYVASARIVELRPPSTSSRWPTVHPISTP
jgi:hypothetical protein